MGDQHQHEEHQNENGIGARTGLQEGDHHCRGASRQGTDRAHPENGEEDTVGGKSGERGPWLKNGDDPECGRYALAAAKAKPDRKNVAEEGGQSDRGVNLGLLR